MTRELAVTVVGPDRTGIVAAVSQVLADLGGNLEDSSMTILRGHFAMTLIVSADAAAARVQEALDPVCDGLGVRATVAEVTRVATSAAEGTAHLLTVHGADRPGIVAAVTAAVAAHDGNITDLTTRLSGDLYVLVCEVDLPPGAEVDRLAAELDRLSGQLGVHASLRDTHVEVL